MTIRMNPAAASWKMNPASANAKMYPVWQPSSNYAEITIDHTKLTGSVTDLVIPLTGRDLSAGFWSSVDAAGLSIVVTDAHSNRILRRQVPHIDTVGETLEVYVRVPRISATTDTDLLLSVAPYTLAQDMLTWPSSWVFASDMSDDDAGTGILDWSRFGNHGTKGAGAAAPTEVAGTVARAQEFDGGQFISVAESASIKPDAWTLAVLMTITDATRIWQTPFAWATAAYSPQVVLNISLSRSMLDMNHDSPYNRRIFGAALWTTLSDGNPHLLSCGLAGADIDDILTSTLHLDGASVAATSTANSVAQRPKSGIYIGANSAALQRPSYSLIDELWLSSVTLSPDEHVAIDAALRGTATFYGVTNHF